MRHAYKIVDERVHIIVYCAFVSAMFNNKTDVLYTYADA
jgi:hypothetical protein